jgi:hypothetical protein
MSFDYLNDLFGKFMIKRFFTATAAVAAFTEADVTGIGSG